MLNKNTKAMVPSPYGDTDFFGFVAGIFQGDSLIPYQSRDLIKENGFTLKMARSRRYPGEPITDADYTDDIVLLTNTPTQAESLLPAPGRRRHWPPCECEQNGVHVFWSKRRHLYSKWRFSEISKQFYVPQQQHLIYWKWCQHAPSEAVDCYR